MTKMSAVERETLLAKWVRPSSDNEVTQQERAVRMVTEAIEACLSLKGVDRNIYAKGSYANNTNVRLDSDVDVSVDCHALLYWDYAPYVTQPTPPLPGSPYKSPWTPTAWRTTVVAAMEKKFGKADVDTSGSVAIQIKEVPGSRPSIDVVPGFHYRMYTVPDRSAFHDGSCVYPATGARLINWPAQQLKNGRLKNDNTGKRYKDFVRVLKNAENKLASDGTIPELASYLMECLVYNVANPTLSAGTRDQAFRATLVELWSGLEKKTVWEDWVEPSRLKYMFRGKKKWTVEEAQSLVLETWKYLGYAS